MEKKNLKQKKRNKRLKKYIPLLISLITIVSEYFL